LSVFPSKLLGYLLKYAIGGVMLWNWFFYQNDVKNSNKKSMHIDLDEMVLFLPKIDWYKFWL
jgi:hypothetical protein